MKCVSQPRRSRCRCAALAVLFGLAAGCGQAAQAAVNRPESGRAMPPLSAEASARVTALARDSIERLVRNQWAPGIMVGITVRGERTLLHAGVRSFATAEPMDGQTLFEIGSISKVITGLLLCDAVVRNSARFDEPVAALLGPKVVVPSFDGKPITLEQLAVHSSGLPRLPSNFAPQDPANPYADYDPSKLLAFLSTYSLPRAPGAEVEYSNLGAGLLGLALAAREGTSYDELLTRRVAGPLGLTDTFVRIPQERRARMAQGYALDNTPVPLWDGPVLEGAGGIRSSVPDMLTLLEAYLDPESSALAVAITLQERERKTASGESVLPGFALGSELGLSNAVLWHNGGTGGFHAFAAVDRAHGLGLLLVANSPARELDQLGVSLLRAQTEADVSFELPRVVELPEATLEKYVGTYRLSPDFAITTFVEGRRLYAQATGQEALALFPESALMFHLREVQAQISFEVDAQGSAVALTLHQGGVDQRGPREAP